MIEYAGMEGCERQRREKFVADLRSGANTAAK